MDSYKRPYRGSKIYVRKKDKEDDTLVKLYKQSEFTKEDAASDALDDDDSSNQDIDDFINDSEGIDEEKIPVKKSVQKARKKEHERDVRNKSIKRTVAKIFAAIIVLAVVVFGGLWFFKPSLTTNNLDDIKQENAIADELYYSTLTGLESKDKNATVAEVTCIMIENSVDARPQSGLSEAGVVYEAVAEGGITRFMALYQDEKPTWIGPIRSARQTFVELARPYNCGYIHVGGATNAINTLKQTGYRDLDGGWFEGTYVFRTADRWAPHNVYTSFSDVDKWNIAKGYRESKFSGFKRIKPDTIVEPQERNATNITIVMSGDDSYNTIWKYDANTNKYYRSHAYGGAHMDRKKNNQQSQITTDVLVAMKVGTTPRASEPKYYDHKTTGSGEAYVFQNGTVQPATWRRANVTDELKFFDSQNNEIELNRGHTWVSIYSNTVGGRVSWKK